MQLCRPFWALALLHAAGCAGDEPANPCDGYAAPTEPGFSTPSDVPLLGTDCDPLVPTACGLPFPSNVYLVDDPDGKNPSGKSVRFGNATLPKTFGTHPMDASLFHELDGFSSGIAPMTHLPGAQPDGLATPDSIADSLSDASPTILLDAETGERVPHFVDLDHSTDNDGQDDRPDERALMIRPVVRLKDETRYIVAIRNVKNRDGADIAPSRAFCELKGGVETDEPSVARRRDLYADIFERLENAGIHRDDLQIAWDYTTPSKAGTTRRLLHMRDDALATVGADGPSFVVKSVEPQPNEHIKYRITLTMTVPLYLNHPRPYDPDDAEPALMLGDDGLPVQNGTMEQDVAVHVPNSVDSGEKHGLLQNGHGLFGSMHEGENGYLARIADEYHFIACSTDLFGFAHEDVSLAVNGLGARPSLLKAFIARQHQGHVNQLLVMRMMMGRIAKHGIEDADGTLLLAPAVIDASVRAYRGDSQGGIMGAVYMALSTDVTRGLLGEAGFPYDLLLNRSMDWPAFGFVLSASYRSALERQIVVAGIQMFWDRTEPNGWAPYLTSGDLANTPPHRVLLHDARGDQQVTTYATHILARTIGAVNMESNDAGQKLIRDVWGVEPAPETMSEGSAMVEYEFGLKQEPLINKAASDGDDPHDRVRGLTPSYQQQDLFFRTGEIKWFCDGVCNCDGAGAEEGC